MSPTGLGVAYNPITNPIPNFTQNPYILRQKQMAMSSRVNDGATPTTDSAAAATRPDN